MHAYKHAYIHAYHITSQQPHRTCPHVEAAAPFSRVTTTYELPQTSLRTTNSRIYFSSPFNRRQYALVRLFHVPLLCSQIPARAFSFMGLSFQPRNPTTRNVCIYDQALPQNSEVCQKHTSAARGRKWYLEMHWSSVHAFSSGVRPLYSICTEYAAQPSK